MGARVRAIARMEYNRLQIADRRLQIAVMYAYQIIMYPIVKNGYRITHFVFRARQCCSSCARNLMCLASYRESVV